ncbi:MAG TPA: deoxyribonuclease IV [Candidatus Avacidaminococcus intestinavium]|uniref:Probable endonuclease 4 n=1 Tax=Candidatus Avacidaminococcus intestinavium TaxID=2840684 RepID=A0A9D1MQ63_9FIRM|nr:deoxyribonuclease IV [Candidatus Avacidaminococcus intestinavium]
MENSISEGHSKVQTTPKTGRLRIGCHLSSSKGYLAMGKEAVRIGADTFQFFSRNPRGSVAKALDEQDVAAYREFAAASDLQFLLAHAPYTMNPCSADAGLRALAKRLMVDDLQRLEYTPGSCYNFHPGSHVKQGVEVGIKYITELLNEVLTKEQTTTVLLETMAGKGTEVGRSFEELQAILAGVELKHKMGVCLDTCHIFDGGYDIVNDLDGVLSEFDRLIGLEKLKAVHLNDSLNVLGSHKDRHAKIGEGNIGLAAFERIINHPALRDLPFYLETPNDQDGYAHEIALLRELYR